LTNKNRTNGDGKARKLLCAESSVPAQINSIKTNLEQNRVYTSHIPKHNNSNGEFPREADPINLIYHTQQKTAFFAQIAAHLANPSNNTKFLSCCNKKNQGLHHYIPKSSTDLPPQFSSLNNPVICNSPTQPTHDSSLN
jgi:hypothetical protein